MSARFVLVPEDELAELIRSAVAEVLQARPAGDAEYIDKHSAGSVGLSASGFVAHCRAGHFPVERRGRRYVARRADVLAYLAAPPKPKGTPLVEPVAAPAADPIESMLQGGRLALVKRT